jgi:hypothetical protein
MKIVHEDLLVSQLKTLRCDPQIRNHILEVDRALKKDLRAQPVSDFLETYIETINAALHTLAREHLAPYYTSVTQRYAGSGKEAAATMLEDEAFVLLSYNSALGMPNSRVTDLKTDSLYAHERKMGAHIDSVLQDQERGWLSIAERNDRLEIHQLAQSPVIPHTGAPVRVSVYILSSTGEPVWLRDFDERDGFIFDRSGHIPVGAIFRCSLLSEDIGSVATELKRFVETFFEKESGGSERYPTDPLTIGYQAYVEYLKHLLLWESGDQTIPLCLCTIAISDELSNVPLGTAMIFSAQPIHPTIATGIHDLCFDLFNAFYKLEITASARQETALLVTNWVSHEATHWALGVKNHTAKLKGRKCAQCDSQNVDPTIVELEALATTIDLTTQLTKQMSSREEPRLERPAFNHAVSEILLAVVPKACQNSYTPFSEYGEKITRALLLVCVELVRNGVRHKCASKMGDVRIEVRAQEDDSGVALIVKSEPHTQDSTDFLAELNALEMFSLDEAYDDKLGKRLGGRMVKRLMQILGGDVRWEWEPVEPGSSRYRVTAICSVPAN